MIKRLICTIIIVAMAFALAAPPVHAAKAINIGRETAGSFNAKGMSADYTLRLDSPMDIGYSIVVSSNSPQGAYAVECYIGIFNADRSAGYEHHLDQLDKPTLNSSSGTLTYKKQPERLPAGTYNVRLSIPEYLFAEEDEYGYKELSWDFIINYVLTITIGDRTPSNASITAAPGTGTGSGAGSGAGANAGADSGMKSMFGAVPIRNPLKGRLNSYTTYMDDATLYLDSRAEIGFLLRFSTNGVYRTDEIEWVALVYDDDKNRGIRVSNEGWSDGFALNYNQGEAQVEKAPVVLQAGTYRVSFFVNGIYFHEVDRFGDLIDNNLTVDFEMMLTSDRAGASELTGSGASAPSAPPSTPSAPPPPAPSAGQSSGAHSDITVIVNDVRLSFDQPPIIENGRTLVPMRAIFEALNCTVEWYAPTQTVFATTETGEYITMTIGDKLMTMKHDEIILDVPPKLVNGRTLVPARAIAEALDADVSWHEASSTVFIYYRFIEGGDYMGWGNINPFDNY